MVAGMMQTANAAGAVTGNLALAMRIGAGSSDPTGSQQASAATAQSLEGLVTSGLGHRNTDADTSDDSEQQQKREPDSPEATNLLADATVVTPGNSPQTEHVTSTNAAHTSDFEAELSKFQEPVRGAHVQISGADSQRVDIRLVEHAGTLSVTVRSGDTSLTRALQENSSELNSRLTAEHFHTELWTPTSTKDSAENHSNRGNSQWQPDSYTPDRNPDQRQNGKQSSRPDWVDVLENSSRKIQKRIDYTWHQ